jgi:hypothetical protein
MGSIGKQGRYRYPHAGANDTRRPQSIGRSTSMRLASSPAIDNNAQGISTWEWLHPEKASRQDCSGQTLAKHMRCSSLTITRGPACWPCPPQGSQLASLPIHGHARRLQRTPRCRPHFVADRCSKDQRTQGWMHGSARCFWLLCKICSNTVAVWCSFIAAASTTGAARASVLPSRPQTDRCSIRKQIHLGTGGHSSVARVIERKSAQQ